MHNAIRKPNFLHLNLKIFSTDKIFFFSFTFTHKRPVSKIHVSCKHTRDEHGLDSKWAKLISHLILRVVHNEQSAHIAKKKNSPYSNPFLSLIWTSYQTASNWSMVQFIFSLAWDLERENKLEMTRTKLVDFCIDCIRHGLSPCFGSISLDWFFRSYHFVIMFSVYSTTTRGTNLTRQIPAIYILRLNAEWHS